MNQEFVGVGVNWGLDVNLEYGDLENGNLKSKTRKQDHSMPNNHAPTPHSTYTLHKHPPPTNPNTPNTSQIRDPLKLI